MTTPSNFSLFVTCFILGGVVWFVLMTVDQVVMVFIPKDARRGCGGFMALFATAAGVFTTAVFLYAWLSGVSS